MIYFVTHNTQNALGCDGLSPFIAVLLECCSKFKHFPHRLSMSLHSCILSLLPNIHPNMYCRHGRKKKKKRSTIFVIVKLQTICSVLLLNIYLLCCSWIVWFFWLCGLAVFCFILYVFNRHMQWISMWGDVLIHNLLFWKCNNVFRDCRTLLITKPYLLNSCKQKLLKFNPALQPPRSFMNQD